VTRKDEFLAHVLELLAPAGAISARRMFGGHGLYCDGLFFGILHDDLLFLKADDRNRGNFERAGCEIFTYSRKGKHATLNFYRAPEDAMDAPQAMLPWARSAVSAALRARAAAGKRPVSGRKPGRQKSREKRR